MKRLALAVALAGIMLAVNGCAVYATPYPYSGGYYGYAPYGGYYGYPSSVYLGVWPRYYGWGWRGGYGWGGGHGWRGRGWR